MNNVNLLKRWNIFHIFRKDLLIQWLMCQVSKQHALYRLAYLAPIAKPLIWWSLYKHPIFILSQFVSCGGWNQFEIKHWQLPQIILKIFPELLSANDWSVLLQNYQSGKRTMTNWWQVWVQRRIMLGRPWLAGKTSPSSYIWHTDPSMTSQSDQDFLNSFVIHTTIVQLNIHITWPH